MDERNRDFIANHVLRLVELSECRVRRSSVIFIDPDSENVVGHSPEWVSNTSVLVSSFSSDIVEGYITSPIVDSYLKFSNLNFIGVNKPLIACSYFPSLEEFMFLSHTKLRTLYYMGVITDGRAVKFLNKITKDNPDDGFEIIKIKIN